MSALGDAAAALLPPEAGGPEPERVATVARRMIVRMPRAAQVGLGGALLGLEGLSLARSGRTLGAASQEQREALLKQVARFGGAPLVDSVKSIVLLAHGADTFAAEIAAVGSRHQPSRPDPQMAIVPAAEWPHGSSCDAIVIGSGAGGAFAARAVARAGLDTVIVEEGERWTVERIRGSHPLDRFAGIYRDGGTTMALGNPPIALPLGRAIGGTTVINSGTCYRPPVAVATAWHREHGFALADLELLGPRIADAFQHERIYAELFSATRPAAGVPASARSAVPTTPRAASTSTPCPRPARRERESSRDCGCDGF